MTDKELADHLDAQDRLRARGLERYTCETCKGTGANKHQSIYLPYVPCFHCRGRGYTWEPKRIPPVESPEKA